MLLLRRRAGFLTIAAVFERTWNARVWGDAHIALGGQEARMWLAALVDRLRDALGQRRTGRDHESRGGKDRDHTR